MKVTPLMVLYGLAAAAGAVMPWYYNLAFMGESGEVVTPQRWLAEGFATPLAGSIRSDFLIGTMRVWMEVEGRRLGMRHLWVDVLGTFLVAFASTCPLFLLMREVHLRRARPETP